MYGFDSRAILIGVAFILIFGILGKQYFDHVTYGINKAIWKTKGLLGIEQSRGIEPFKSLPGWVNTIAGAIIGWVIKRVLDWFYVKIKKKYFNKRRSKRRIV